VREKRESSGRLCIHRNLKSPRKLLVRDQSTRPAQLAIKNGRENHEGWLIPTPS